MIAEQEKEFWNILEAFKTEGLLQHVMLIGSWAEYIYQNCFESGFKANLRTTDVDFLYHNLRRPIGKTIDIKRALGEKGFVYSENRLSGVGKFVKDDVLDIEFLIRVLGEGDPQHRKIPSIGVVGIGLRDVNMLASYPLVLDVRGYTIIVPEPEIYVLHKSLISSKRKKSEKREKDIQSVRNLIPHINRERMNELLSKLPAKQRAVIKSVSEGYFLEI
jgi:hypothetical protein